MTPTYALPDAELLAQCEVHHLRGGGPGGQHRNKTETGIRLVHKHLGVTSVSQDFRETERNRSQALHQLRLRLACQERGRADRAWLDTRCRGGRLTLTPRAAGYHLVVAVLLDALASAAGSLTGAALVVGVSTSQMVKDLTADPEVHRAANALRAGFGLSPVRG